MARLLVHVEGQTEEQFVKELLRDHLIPRGYRSVDARLLGHARQRLRRGGMRSWTSVRNEIAGHLKGDPGCIATTMVDYYGMLEGWPGRALATGLPDVEKAKSVERALLDDVTREFKRRIHFVPFVVMHEFEALLFSDCAALSRGIGQPALQEHFQNVRDRFATPEEINDSPESAPSKRIESIVPRYQKPLLGIRAARAIGLQRMRAECPHFHDWLTRIESLCREVSS